MISSRATSERIAVACFYLAAIVALITHVIAVVLVAVGLVVSRRPA